MNFTNIWKLCNEGSYETIILKLSNYSNQIIKNNYDRLLWECCINDKLDLGKWFYNNLVSKIIFKIWCVIAKKSIYIIFIFVFMVNITINKIRKRR